MLCCCLPLFLPLMSSDSAHRVQPAKIRGVTLPEEYELARLIQNIENPLTSWNTHTPACSWEKVECNSEQQVLKINWSLTKLHGSLHAEHIPRHLYRFDVWHNKLHGAFTFVALPSSLVLLDLSKNAFSVAPDLSHLPPMLKELILRDNRLEGYVNLSSFPVSLTHLWLYSNPELGGDLNVAVLPRTLGYDVRDTQIRVTNGPDHRRVTDN